MSAEHSSYTAPAQDPASLLAANPTQLAELGLLEPAPAPPPAPPTSPSRRDTRRLVGLGLLATGAGAGAGWVYLGLGTT